MTYNTLPQESPKLQAFLDYPSSEALDLFADQMISNLERLIPNLTKIQDNVDKEIGVIQTVASHTQAYA